MTCNHLFQPIQIGGTTLPNRVMMGSMHVGLEGIDEDGEALIAFYRERAGTDGPSLIVTGGIAVSPEGEGGGHFHGFYREKDCRFMQRMNDEIHRAGGRMAAQLFHAGRYAHAFAGKGTVAPSAIQSPITRFPPRALTSGEIEALIEKYAASAAKAKEVGFDAIEIMGSEGYLINQFLSPVTNQRDDEWGGDFERRTRFPLAIIKAIRREVGKDCPVIFRLSGADLVPDSTTEDETLRFARMVQEAGVDLINVGIGWHESRVPTISMMVPRAGFAPIARKIKEAVEIPVVGSNRINDPLLADRLIEQGDCDMVSMARPFLADPDLLRKARREEYDRINTCIACNQACLDHIFEGKPASCLVNPRAGREWKWPLSATDNRKTVVVIGGGAAGMEAARSQAEIGNRVILYEKSDRLGGQLNLATRIPGKEEFNETLRFYRHELDRLEVDIRFNHTPSAAEIMEDKPDLVVISTGVRPRVPSIPGVDLPHVMSYPEALREPERIGKQVAIIGAGGIGCDLAHFLTEQGDHQVVLMRRKGKMGENLGKTTRWALISHLYQQGVRFLNNLRYEKIEKDGVLITLFGEEGAEQKKIPADTVILAAGQESVLFDQERLKQAGIPVVTVGGAREAGELDAKRAIYDGARLAYSTTTV
ncbi:MAG: FAD-dependent oxidoreductase [Bacillaceae bacterium]|nr:FAD-dependent oxidoreductase [Bacillaceae bacterium]